MKNNQSKPQIVIDLNDINILQENKAQSSTVKNSQMRSQNSQKQEIIKDGRKHDQLNGLDQNSKFKKNSHGIDKLKNQQLTDIPQNPQFKTKSQRTSPTSALIDKSQAINTSFMFAESNLQQPKFRISGNKKSSIIYQTKKQQKLNQSMNYSQNISKLLNQNYNNDIQEVNDEEDEDPNLLNILQNQQEQIQIDDKGKSLPPRSRDSLERQGFGNSMLSQILNQNIKDQDLDNKQQQFTVSKNLVKQFEDSKTQANINQSFNRKFASQPRGSTQKNKISMKNNLHQHQQLPEILTRKSYDFNQTNIFKRKPTLTRKLSSISSQSSKSLRSLLGSSKSSNRLNNTQMNQNLNQMKRKFKRKQSIQNLKHSRKNSLSYLDQHISKQNLEVGQSIQKSVMQGNGKSKYLKNVFNLQDNNSQHANMLQNGSENTRYKSNLNEFAENQGSQIIQDEQIGSHLNLQFQNQLDFGDHKILKKKKIKKIHKLNAGSYQYQAYSQPGN
eukprot:403334066